MEVEAGTEALRCLRGRGEVAVVVVVVGSEFVGAVALRLIAGE